MKRLVVVAVVIGLLLVVIWRLGFYSVQPIGALPEGVTMIVWRASDEPLCNSPDALCLRIQGGVSLLCRGLALEQAPTDRIILRLPYMEWAYVRSTGGRTFER